MSSKNNKIFISQPYNQKTYRRVWAILKLKKVKLRWSKRVHWLMHPYRNISLRASRRTKLNPKLILRTKYKDKITIRTSLITISRLNSISQEVILMAFLDIINNKISIIRVRRIWIIRMKVITLMKLKVRNNLLILTVT